MVLRDELEKYLEGIYNPGFYADHCVNGLQVEGKNEIRKIVFGVSFNLAFLEKALEEKPDAIIVHHGIFQEGLFSLKGRLYRKVKRLLTEDVSLFGIHLPMDGHAEAGHNALLLSKIGASELEPFEVGFIGKNSRGLSLDAILEIYHKFLHPAGDDRPSDEAVHSVFAISRKYGFTVLKHGPDVPQRIAVISGGSSGFYEKAINMGADTYFAGDIKENTPALADESGTNFVNLGHYYSETPGILALKKRVEKEFNVETVYIDISNPV